MALQYFLTIDGIAGGSTATGHEGAFGIVDYSFDVSSLVNAATAGTGAGAGKSTFSPLTVDLDPGSDLAALFKDVAAGEHIKSVELQGVSTDGTTVYDLKLGDVFITTLHDTNTGHDSLQLSYGQISLTTTPEENSDGSPGTPSTASWNLITNAQDVAIPDPVVPAGTGESGGGAHSYFLTIDGIAGGSTATGHEGAFEIADYSFDVSSLTGIGSAGTGAGAGKSTFSPLTVDLDPGSDPPPCSRTLPQASTSSRSNCRASPPTAPPSMTSSLATSSSPPSTTPAPAMTACS
jgi:type VI protein secretion system component Hcp